MCVSAGPGVNGWASLNSADRVSSLKMVEQGQRGLGLDLTERMGDRGRCRTEMVFERKGRVM